MATRLRKIRFREVSLCGRGANQHAHVVLAKAMADHDYSGDGDHCTKCGEPRNDHPEKAEKGADHLTGGRTPTVRPDSTKGDPEVTMPEIDKSKLDPEVAKHVEALEAKVAELSKTAEPTVEDLLKDADPKLAEIVKAAKAEAAEALALAKANQERAEAEILKAEVAAEEALVKSLDNLGVDITKTATALQQLHKASPEAYADMVTALKAANAQAEAGELFKELGSTANEGDGSTAWDRLQAIGKRLHEEGKAATLEQGIEKALKENAQLARQYAEQNFGNAG